MGNLISNIGYNNRRRRLQVIDQIDGGETKRKKKQQVVIFIPQDLLEQILLNLPVKSVIRCKSVSKTWARMIHSPSFRESYSQRHRLDYSNQLVYSPYAVDRKFFTHRTNTRIAHMIKATPGPSDLLLPLKMTRLRQIPRFYNDLYSVVRVLGPLSNGIYLLTNLYYKSTGFSIYTGKVALCNPAMHIHKFIGSAFPYHDPAFSRIYEKMGRRQFRLHYGLGTSATSGYKVVVLIQWGPRFSSFVSFVYHVRRGSWKKVADYQNGRRDYRGVALGLHYPEINGPDLELCPQRFLNGCWHWMVILSTTQLCSIMSFDFTRNSFKLVAAPPSYHHYMDDNDPCHRSGVLVLDGHLATIFFPSPCSRIQIWMMMEYGIEESWAMVYSIRPNFDKPLTRLVGISSLKDDECGGRQGGYGIQTIFFQDSHNELISCNASGYKKHGSCDISSSLWWNTLGISNYIETIKPL